MKGETLAERARRLQQEAEAGRAIGREEYRRRTRRSFLKGGAAAVAGVLGWRWVQTQPLDDRIPSVLRRGHELNEELWSRLYDGDRMAPTFSLARARPLRVNGRIGLRSELDPDSWRLDVVGPDGSLLDHLSLEEVTDLPRVEQVTEHKCIEGWSTVTHWSGVRFSDFAARYPPSVRDVPYVSMATPDAVYYVGLDMPSAMHPQTLLAFGLSGEPLTPAHGAPLRLVTPLKYGIKSIKRLGTIRFSRERPGDYWAERGYDWYLGH